MKLTRAVQSAFAFSVVILAFGCADQFNPVAPVTETTLSPQAEPLASRRVDTRYLALFKKHWTMPAFARVTITPDGGSLSAGDVTLTVPAGAVDRDTDIAVLVPGGRHKIALFFPHGLQFDAPARLSFAAGDAESFDRSEVKGAYIGRGAARSDALYNAEELFDVTLTGASIDFDISHFSGYIVASGRHAGSGF